MPLGEPLLCRSVIRSYVRESLPAGKLDAAAAPVPDPDAARAEAPAASPDPGAASPKPFAANPDAGTAIPEPGAARSSGGWPSMAGAEIAVGKS